MTTMLDHEKLQSKIQVINIKTKEIGLKIEQAVPSAYVRYRPEDGLRWSESYCVR